MLGVIGLSLNQLFGYGTMSFLVQNQDEFTGVRYTTINIQNYISNIQKTFYDIDKLILELPTKQWSSDIVNNLKIIVDYLIMIVNVTLYPLRAGAYVTKLLLAILGIDLYTGTQNGISWLITFINAMQGGIPYI